MRLITGALAILIAGLIAMTGAWASSPFLFFFDSGSARLSPQALSIIDIAAWAFRNLEAREVELYAATDRVGSAASNRRLSRRRAEAVKAALVERGIPAQVITLKVCGEDRPLIPTADGVPEPQNRYVWVVLRPCRSQSEDRLLPGC